MSFVVKRRDLSDPAQLQALIVEHADDLERGLTILDSRLLGQVTIDVVGLDADSALVLIAVGLVANEEMLLKAVDAYSWCLEYPDAIRRLYPAVQCSNAQPPRVMFVVERMPDAFHRKIKQLGFPAVDCVEFRHLDVNGTAAVYFDTLARLRRGAVPAAPSPAPPTPPTPPAPPAMSTSNERLTSVKLQKLLGADRPVAARERAPIVRMVPRSSPRSDTGSVVIATRTEGPGAPNALVEEPLVTAGAVAERFTDVPEALLDGLDVANALVEVFATAEPEVRNGHVEPDIAIALPETAPVRERVPAPVDAFLPQPPSIDEPPAPAVREPGLELAAPTLGTLDPEPAMPITLELEWRPVVDAEPKLKLPLETPPVGDSHPQPEPKLELEARPLVEAESELELDLEPHPLVEAEPEVKRELESPPLVDTRPELKLELQPHAPIHAEPELRLELESPVNAEQTPSVTEPQPAMAAISTEPAVAEAAPASTPSVFSRRAPEAVAARDAKVSFAGMAKDLLPQNHRTPVAEPPVAAPRASVEEITRGALDELVGSADKRTTDDRPTAFAKPGNAFAKASPQKRPRTIAPPPSDGQPIAGAPKRVEVTEPAAPPADGETAHASPQGFDGPQFPNDGVLTRQWMEFLNQMAAGK